MTSDSLGFFPSEVGSVSLPLNLSQSWCLPCNQQNTAEVALLPKQVEKKNPHRMPMQFLPLLLGCLFWGSQLMHKERKYPETHRAARPSEDASVSSPDEQPTFAVSCGSHCGHPAQCSCQKIPAQLTFDFNHGREPKTALCKFLTHKIVSKDLVAVLDCYILW